MADANYLRRYQSVGGRKRKSKKKDRDKKQAASKRTTGMRIVEMDADDWGYDRSRENEGVSEAEDEAPVLVDDVIRKELPKRKKGTWSNIDVTTHSNVVKHLNSDDDLSPLRKGRVRSDDENSISLRKGNLDSDDEDLSPPRKAQLNGDAQKSPHPEVGMQFHKEEDLSHPRKGRVDNDDDLSPPRKGGVDSDGDLSPPRKVRIGSDDDLSPPRKRRIDSDDDLSLPRKGRIDSDDDLSPPRQGRVDSKDDLSPPRKARIDSDDDISPPGGGREQSDKDLSPPRRGRIDSDEDEPHDSGLRGRKSTNAHSLLTERTVAQCGGQPALGMPHAPKAESALRDSKQTVQTSEGHVAGLIKGSDFREAEAKLRAKRAAAQAAEATKQPAAETVYRDRRGRKLDMLNEFMRIEAEREGKRREAREEFEWGRGTKQKNDEEVARQELETIKNEPFARSIDDPQLEKMRREAIRDGDPMVQYVLSKRDAGSNPDRASKIDDAGSARPTRNVYKGPNVAPNRYGIRPGYRWDGIDRSNGWEAKLQTKTAEAVGLKGDRYAWSSADM